MRRVERQRSEKTLGVTLCSVMILLFGLTYFGLVVYHLYLNATAEHEKNLGGVIKSFFQTWFTMLLVFFYSLEGAMGILAGIGSLLRKNWGRILCYVFIGISMGLTVYVVLTVNFRFPSTFYLVFKAILFIGGTIAIVVLAQRKDEFEQPRSNLYSPQFEPLESRDWDDPRDRR